MPRLDGLKRRTRRQPLDVPTPADPRDWELLAFFDQIYCRDNPRIREGSPRTIYDYECNIHVAQEFLDEQLEARGEPQRVLTLRDLTKPFAIGAVNWLLKNGRSVATANKLPRVLIALNRWAVLECDIDLKVLRMRKLPEPKRVPRAWSEDEMRRICAAARRMRGKVGEVPAGRWWLALILVAYHSGGRIGSIMKAPSDGIDFHRGTLCIPAEVQKQNADQLYALDKASLGALAAIQPTRNELIFGEWPYDRTQKHNYRALTHGLRKVLVGAKLFSSIDDIGPRELWHKIRRTSISLVAAALGPDRARLHAGHSAASVTSRYLDPSIANRRGIVLPAIDVRPAPRTAASDAAAAQQDLLGKLTAPGLADGVLALAKLLGAVQPAQASGGTP
jgi:integrase